jgi:predicted ATPase
LTIDEMDQQGLESDQLVHQRDLQAGVRLVTLTGPAGSGKRRVAVEAATELVPEFRNGVFSIGLSALRDSRLVLDSIAQTLGVSDGLAGHLGEGQLLLLLDNFEQVTDAAPELASLVEACPDLRLVITSRELLRVREAKVEYPVPPLDEPEAVELFCSRFRPEPNESVAELCRRLDNLPPRGGAGGRAPSGYGVAGTP